MTAEILSLVASCKTALIIAKDLASGYTDAKVKERTSELLTILVSVQRDAVEMNTKYQELLQEKYNLQKKVMEFEQWSKTKDNYERKELASGIWAYRRKKTDEADDSALWICPYCYNKQQESFLQREFHSETAGSYFCPSCENPFQ